LRQATKIAMRQATASKGLTMTVKPMPVARMAVSSLCRQKFHIV